MDEIEELKRRLKEMTAEAANNETILKKTQGRELSLLRADSLAQLLHAMVDGLRESYSLDAISVVLLDPEHEIRHLLLANGERPDEFKQVFFVDSLVGLAPQLTALHKPWLGPFVGADHHLLFPGSTNLRSAALLLAVGAVLFGVLLGIGWLCTHVEPGSRVGAARRFPPLRGLAVRHLQDAVAKLLTQDELRVGGYAHQDFVEFQLAGAGVADDVAVAQVIDEVADHRAVEKFR